MTDLVDLLRAPAGGVERDGRLEEAGRCQEEEASRRGGGEVGAGHGPNGAEWRFFRASERGGTRRSRASLREVAMRVGAERRARRSTSARGGVVAVAFSEGSLLPLAPHPLPLPLRPHSYRSPPRRRGRKGDCPPATS